MAIFGLGGNPDFVKVERFSYSTWGSASGSITSGSGAPSGDLGFTYYFNLLNFDMYVWDGSAWSGPTPFIFDAGTPNAGYTGPIDYWVQGDISTYTITGGIWGPKTVVNVPTHGDVIIFDGATDEWAATNQHTAIGGYVTFRLEQLVDSGLFLSNVASPPATPSGGGVLYVESGALKYKGSSGTVTTIGNA